MATLVGSLLVSLGLDSGQFSSGLDKSAKQMRATQAKIEAIGGNIVKTGAVLSAGITAPFTALVTSSLGAAQESQQAIGQVNAALASMGPVAGRSSDQLVKLAGDLQNISIFDDDDILKSVTANLLTFGNVSGTAFDRAQLAAVNLSARLGQDLQSSAIQVGKALNDPVKGVTALQRVGVSFTAAQKEQIAAMVEVGNVAGAQSLILGELEKQFGGAAKAQRDATPSAETQQQWRTLEENIGAVAIKVLPPLLSGLTGVLTAFNQLDPSTQAFVVGTVAVAAGLGPVITLVGGLVTVGGTLIPLWGTMMAGAVAFGTGLTTTTIPAVTAFIATLSPVLLPIAAVTAAVAGVVLAVRNWDKIQPYVSAVIGYMQSLYTGVKTWIVDKLAAVWGTVVNHVETAKKAFFNLYDAVVGHSYIPDMVDGIAVHIGRLDEVMVAPIVAGTGKAAAAFNDLHDRVQTILNTLFPDAAAAVKIKADLDALDEAMAKRLIKPEVWIQARERLIAELGKATAAAKEAIAPDLKTTTTQDAFSDDFFASLTKGTILVAQAANDNAEAQKEANAEIVKSYADMAENVAGSISNLVGAIKGGDVLDVLTSIVDVVQTVLGGLQSIGVLKTAAPSGGGGFNGFRAAGGPVVSGRGYIVGEKGPEYFTPSRSGTIIPNDQLGGGSSTVKIVPSPYFDVVVDGRSAVQAGQLMSENNRAAARAGRRRLR